MDFTIRYIRYTGGYLGGYLGPYYSYSYSYSYSSIASERGAIALAQANISQLNSIVNRGTGRYTVNKYTINRYTVKYKYTNIKGALN